MNISGSNKKLLLRSLPFLGLGLLIFTINSSLEMPYMVRGYVTLLEAQLGLLGLFLARPRKTPLEK
jgi:hypothetical protein